ncbi:MAG: phenylalanine--tRNA ligase subunit alpha [Candidatus Brocadiae bacterium]|nr:phenylalanine--tRNA ligase subunit alpha [Candidatus Brocadiia bacterium]
MEQLRAEFDGALAAAGTAADLERLSALWIGREGKLRRLTEGLGALPPEEKKARGKAINELKLAITAAFEARGRALSAAPRGPAPDAIDVTLPGERPRLGRRHPIYSTMEELRDVFGRLGFECVYGPEIETTYYNFEALNIPLDHPAAEPFDTWYLDEPDGGKRPHRALLRSHTSPAQMHVMESRVPPIRVVVPGKVFRTDPADASHLPVFHQIEGLYVDEGVTFADLKGVLSIANKALFGAKTETRFRPSYFPFTEPSAEVDVSCLLCGGTGCPACKGSGWIEILGCGMVHPRVLEFAKIDPARYSGFAFGMGVDRIAMLKLGVTDIRHFVRSHPLFLGQW